MGWVGVSPLPLTPRPLTRRNGGDSALSVSRAIDTSKL